MKTTMNKNTLKDRRNAYISMQDEVNRLRREYRAAKQGMKDEEELILSQMFELIPGLTSALGRFPTADEISKAMNGAVSKNEVVGQMLVALGDHYNGSSYPRPTKNATHKATQAMKGRARRDYEQVTRRFVEVDEKGQVIEGGKAIVKRSTITTYGVRGL